MENELIFDDELINSDFEKIKNSNINEPLPDNTLTPIVPIVDNNIEEQEDNTISMFKSDADKYETPLTILEKSCSANEVMGIVVNQINGLQQDIKDLEEMREMLKHSFLADPKAWRSAYAVENKIKTFTGFYSTILSYKKELNETLFKLRAILTEGNTLSDQVKDVIKNALVKREEINTKTQDNEKRIKEILSASPNLMPKAL